MSQAHRTVSIIIPTYNRSDFLSFTLESCINQTYSKDHYEIIVADNNS
ncbi:MAG: glycosyltransferase, partial [Ignavibacteria bacterium]